MTEAQNESFPILAPWTIMKTEDATNFIHLRDTYCDRIEGCSNIPMRGCSSSQPHSYWMRAETWTTTSPWILDLAGSQGFQYFFTVHEAKILAEE